ncbi:MAG: MBOAT family protein [Lachnospiraceae bacterium]|nr:MBOAT family protein [Lachnospiraceae bacterium]
MLFNSYIFVLLFLPLCLLGYFGLNHMKKYSWAQGFLLVMSLWFYGYFNVKYLFIIVGSILLNYAVYCFIKKHSGTSLAKAMMLVGVIGNIGSIVYFKYMDFFIENVNALFKTNISTLNILLPLGISFFTFQQISFIVDAYKGEVPDYNFLYYASFVVYFPQLIAGPIVTHDELVPQFLDKEKKTLNADNLASGIYIFVFGLAKKVLLADTFGMIVTYGYSNYTSLSAVTALIVIVSYTIQIYFDFSGYCDMAIGIARMMNIDLPLNFDAPYKALTISEFWDRWHMTLTRFLTKYVYIPLGGSRKGAVRTYVNILIVFLVSGIWHGASWNFVIWGLCHGIFMMINRALKGFFDKRHPVFNWFLTFSFVNITWVFFRAETLGQALAVLKALVSWDFTFDNIYIQMFRLPELQKLLSFTKLEYVYPPVVITAFFVIAFGLMLGCDTAYEKMKRFKPTVFNMLTTLFLFVWSVFTFSGISEFLYFNF